MAHSFNKIWLHTIWSTLDQAPLIVAEIEKHVYQSVYDNLRDMGCEIKIINGVSDHIHCLFLMTAKRSITEVIKQAKGASSHYINQNDLTVSKFAWQKGYAAYSVSESMVERAYLHIKNQQKYHQKYSFEQEFNHYLKFHQLING